MHRTSGIAKCLPVVLIATTLAILAYVLSSPPLPAEAHKCSDTNDENITLTWNGNHDVSITKITLRPGGSEELTAHSCKRVYADPPHEDQYWIQDDDWPEPIIRFTITGNGGELEDKDADKKGLTIDVEDESGTTTHDMSTLPAVVTVKYNCPKGLTDPIASKIVANRVDPDNKPISNEIEVTCQGGGGTVELLAGDSDSPASAAEGSGSSAPPYAALAGAAAAVVALATTGGWYARRRWLR